LNKPTEPAETTNTRTLADYYSVPEPWRSVEPRCIAPRDSRARHGPDPELRLRTLPGAVAVAPGPNGPHGPHIGHVDHELKLADVGGEMNLLNPWQALGNTLYEAWLKGPA
jgi:hypothetical protein